ncbi:MAG: hypothetical protein UY03_C0017G0022 [Parcubacteria group bacterium GW2011_GWA2_47_64]|nr:MAG: hypothetical protein UY03_C0017G0022 [Parcubacteria group bacterium GW2011_GWA2_47_64]KKU96846.1 MAG: hypothetical protein UY29_C0006G0055 [Parcubacteria group bacterium GW2011_GWC2_48_17]
MRAEKLKVEEKVVRSAEKDRNCDIGAFIERKSSGRSNTARDTKRLKKRS